MRIDEYDFLAEELREDPHAWRDYAACLDVTEDMDHVIFPWNPSRRDDDAIQEFIENRCDECPVAQRCLDFAMATESEGIWGGVELTPSGIARLKRLRILEGDVTVERAKEVLGRGKV